MWLVNPSRPREGAPEVDMFTPASYSISNGSRPAPKTASTLRLSTKRDHEKALGVSPSKTAAETCHVDDFLVLRQASRRSHTTVCSSRYLCNAPDVERAALSRNRQAGGGFYVERLVTIATNHTLDTTRCLCRSCVVVFSQPHCARITLWDLEFRRTSWLP